MPAQINKLEAHTSHLLSSFIQLRERYAMLEPMLHEEEVIELRGSGKQSHGFLILRHSLFLSCVQDIAKLTLDNDKRTPSIRNLILALEDSRLRNVFRERFSIWDIQIPESETDQEIIKVLKKMDAKEEIERSLKFDEMYDRAKNEWGILSNSAFINGFITIRNKISAHTEVELVTEKYQFIDISKLGIKWSDLSLAINLMQSLVELLGFLIRNTEFAWDSLDAQLSKASHNFWICK